MNIDELLDEWESKDSIIDDHNLDEESRKIPNTHAKYLREYTNSKLHLKMKEMKMKKLLKRKWLYYNGKLSEDDIDKYGWDHNPFGNLNKPLKGEMDYYYDSDTDIQKLQLEIEYQKQHIEVCKEILDSIKWRHQSIKNMIEWRRFISGN
jgi:hypothetical protein